MHRISSIIGSKTTFAAAGIHTSATRLAISKFNLPAMSPTMTEGTIHKWQKKEGEAFSAGDVLLELETDKAQIDVEAPEDGILAKIVLSDGQKAPVNTLIALLAEEGDDISNIEIPKDGESSTSQPKQEEEKQASSTTSKPSQPSAPITPMNHHDIDTSKLKKPLSPSVFGLIMRHHIKDIESIQASGPGGRILKGDVLAHLGLITPQPAPKPRTTCAPPRDQIEFAKPASGKVEKSDKKEKIEAPPNFIERQVSVDALLNLQNGSQQINAILSKAAGKALEEVNGGKFYTGKGNGIVIDQQRTSYSGKYLGGAFKVFHLAEPSYDFITDSYISSKPYILNVNEIQKMQPTKKETMIDVIDYLGGGRGGNTHSYVSSPKNQNKKNGYHVDIKLQGGTPGKIIKDKKAKMFLDRLEYYIRHPDEIIV